MSHPRCDSCGREIQPGEIVQPITPLNLEEVRIITGDDLLLICERCVAQQDDPPQQGGAP